MRIKEAGFEKVRNVLANTQKSSVPVLINELNIGETYYILYRKRGHEQAEYFLDTVACSNACYDRTNVRSRHSSPKPGVMSIGWWRTGQGLTISCRHAPECWIGGWGPNTYLVWQR